MEPNQTPDEPQNQVSIDFQQVLDSTADIEAGIISGLAKDLAVSRATITKVQEINQELSQEIQSLRDQINMLTEELKEARALPAPTFPTNGAKTPVKASAPGQ